MLKALLLIAQTAGIGIAALLSLLILAVTIHTAMPDTEAVTQTLVLDAVLIALVLTARMTILHAKSMLACSRWEAEACGARGVLRSVVSLGLVFLASQSAAMLLAPASADGFEEVIAARAAEPLLYLALTLGIAPIAEELLVRGLLYPLMRTRSGVWTSAVMSALTFSLLHGNLTQMIITLPLGVLLALITEHQGLGAAVGAHLLFNLMALIVPSGMILALASPELVLTLALGAGWQIGALHKAFPRRVL